MANYRAMRVAVTADDLGDNEVIAAQSGVAYKITSLLLVSDGATALVFESGTSGDDLSGSLPMVANMGMVLPHNKEGWMMTKVGHALNLRLSADQAVTGFINYTEIKP